MLSKLPKTELLHQSIDIQQLKLLGQRMTVSPLKIIYLPTNQHQIGVHVPKRLLKLAVHRNRIKRQIKAIYQQYRYQFPEEKPIKMWIMYQKPLLCHHTDIQTAFTQIMQHINKQA